MKRKYEKPMIQVETLELDMPIAVGCTVDSEDMESIVEVSGYFMPDSICKKVEDAILFPGEEDTICYNSNVQTAFMS